ncbi:hypothetical protein D9613_002182 [Agrocybe pediades]|uniref:Uncharacterized protein n=1 Tax=Agrocybe pediades TaxID=84607 RepID=A0A8H4R3W1_9AGAR|nr:hypothetical protein D9613_002182 [Agrocybe pediades]
MYSLNATIAYLRAKKQKYKLKMFERLYYILIFTVFVIAIFFVVSSLSFSGRLAEDYAAKTGVYAVKTTEDKSFDSAVNCFCPYLVLFVVSTLFMSDEIAQDEQDAEDYDLETLHSRHHRQDDDDDDAATLVGGRRGNPNAPAGGEDVVFEIGDEDDDEDEASKKAKAIRLSGENGRGDEERQGLMR